MQITVSGDCEKCLVHSCLDNCPNSLKAVDALKCVHCAVKTAKCRLACKNNAIYEIADGILSINPKRCKGCGRCIKACERSAIEIVDGKAAKCDLCAKNNFDMACVGNCEKGFLKIQRDNKEKEKALELCGWLASKQSESTKRVLSKNDAFEIVEKTDGKKQLMLNVPELSLAEAKLLNSVKRDFQESGFKENELEKVLEKKLKELNATISGEQKEYLMKILKLDIFSFGPLSLIIDSDDFEEIAINGLGEKNPVMIFHKEYGWLETNLFYYDEQIVKNLINKMARLLGRRVTMQNPKINANLPDGSRLNAAIPPISFQEPCMTIRKFRKKPFSVHELIKNRTFSSELAAFIGLAMATDINLLICGNTGSGKTTTLNALFAFVPEDDRIIIVEETPELNIPQKHKVQLNSVEELGFGMKELIENSLRMRPDRVIVGEIRSKAEIQAFIETILAGQGKGSFATFHAQSSREALLRLKNSGVNELDLASIDLILVQRRWDRIDLQKESRKELRRVIELSEIVEEKGEIKLNQLFKYNPKTDSVEKANKSLRVKNKLMNAYSFNAKSLKRELEKQKNALETKF